MTYTLPKLNYAYSDLEPYMAAETVELHYTKHHQAYVDGLINAENKVCVCRETGDDTALKDALQALAFHGSGHYLHCLFWENMCPHGHNGALSSELEMALQSEFGSIDTFKKEFIAAGVSVEGNGWVILGMHKDTHKLSIYQHLNHQHSDVAGYIPLLVCDMWEHSYYITYRNRRLEYLQNYFPIVNYEIMSARYKAIKG